MRPPVRKTKEAITPAEYQAFQEAYDFFNIELFGGSLPHVLVTLQRHAKARGYFSPERFTGRVERAALRFAARKRDPRSRWIEAVRERRGANIAAVALANRNARVLWALLARNEDYRVPAAA